MIKIINKYIDLTNFCTMKAPHCIHMRNGVKFGDTSLTDTMMSDGLTDTFNQYHMGITGKICQAN